MTTVGEDLRTLVLASAAVSASVGSRMHQGRVPQDVDGSSNDYIWFQRSSEEEQRDMENSGGLKKVRFDIECISADASNVQSLADNVKTQIDGHSGTMGNISAQGIFVEDKDDDYIPRGVNSDDGRFVAALDVVCWVTT